MSKIKEDKNKIIKNLEQEKNIFSEERDLKQNDEQVLDKLKKLIKKRVNDKYNSKVNLSSKEEDVLTEWGKYVEEIKNNGLILDLYTGYKDGEIQGITTSLTNFLENRSTIFGSSRPAGSAKAYGVYKIDVIIERGKYYIKDKENNEKHEITKEQADNWYGKREKLNLFKDNKINEEAIYKKKGDAEDYFNENVRELYETIMKGEKEHFDSIDDFKIIKLFQDYQSKQILYKMFVLNSYKDRDGSICSYDDKMFELYKKIYKNTIDSYNICLDENDFAVFKKDKNQKGIFYLEGKYIIREGKNKYIINDDSEKTLYKSAKEAKDKLEELGEQGKCAVKPIKLKIDEEILNYFYKDLEDGKRNKVITKIISDVLVDYYYLQGMFDEFKENHNVIFYGPPGTGKTYNVKRFLDFNCVESKFIQCHPNFTYDEFIEGFKPIGIIGGQLNLDIVNGVFKQFCIDAKNDLENDYYFICDEINRANVSQMFGECLSLIESDYRDFVKDDNGDIKRNCISTPMSQTLTKMIRSEAEDKKTGKIAVKDLEDAYKKYKDKIYELKIWYKDDDNKKNELTYKEFEEQAELKKNNIEITRIEARFGIPRNIYFIGMMNDVDKSIDSFDLALRRRFAWVLKECDYKVIENYLLDKGYSKEDVAAYIGKCKKINNKLINDYGKSYQLGHSYFMKIVNYIKGGEAEIDDKSKELLFKKHIQPLLVEYLRSFETENDIDIKIKDIRKIFGLKDVDNKENENNENNENDENENLNMSEENNNNENDVDNDSNTAN